jgi:predicted  nucleic acid-binding Zn-ribbon protein
MLPEIERLLILQDRDKKARALRAELKNLPVERKNLEQKLADARHQAGDAKTRQRNAEVEQARLETEIRSRRDQINKYETQKLQTRKNEEYQALNHSIEHVRKEISGIEDRQIELMETLEALKPEVASSEKAAAYAAALVQRQLTDLDTKAKNLELQLSELEASRNKYTEGVSEDLLDTYKRLFTTKTEAVVALNHEVCSGCHMKVTASTAAATRVAKSVVHCEQCNRILYQGEA